MLDGGHNRLEVILSRDKPVDVVTLDAEDLVIAIVVGIELQTLELQAVVMVGKGKVGHLNVSRRIVKRVAPERGSSIGRETVIGVIAIYAHAGQVQPID